MDVAFPIRAVVSTLDGPVLAVLARTTRPLTGREVHRLTETGSANGVRLALGRLADQGIVTAEQRAAAVFYEANREHLAWPAIEILAGLRHTLLERLRDELVSWRCQPLHAALFGSAARGSGDADSDIDVLIVRPDDVDEDNPTWTGQLDLLRDQVQRWTGNRCQIFQLDLGRLAQHVEVGDPLVDEWRRDAVLLGGQEVRAALRDLSRSDEDS